MIAAHLTPRIILFPRLPFLYSQQRHDLEGGMRLSRRGVIVGLVVILLAGGIVYGSARLLSGGETVLYQEPESAGPDPFTDPAVFTSDTEVVTTTTTTTTTTTVPAASPSPPVTTTVSAPTQPAQAPFGG